MQVYVAAAVHSTHVRMILFIVRLSIIFSLNYLDKHLRTYTSIALFQLITYPERTNVSIWSIWIFPRSVPTYNHLLCSGKWMHVILFEIEWIIRHHLKKSFKYEKDLNMWHERTYEIYCLAISWNKNLFVFKSNELPVI